MTTKTILLPTYKDLHKTLGWEKLFENIPDIEVKIYEKVDGITKPVIKHNSHIQIPNHGRSSYAFIQHVCENYDDLADVVCLTKTHIDIQGIKISESISRCHNYDHLEFWNSLRVFVWASPEYVNNEQVTRLCKPLIHPGPPEFQYGYETTSSSSDLMLDEYISEEFNDYPYSHTMVMLDRDQQKHVIEQRLCYSRLINVWPDYKVPNVYVGRQENVWSIKKEVIRFHPLSFYIELRDSIETSSQGTEWNIGHDDWCLFWPLFWNETIQRMNRED